MHGWWQIQVSRLLKIKPQHRTNVGETPTWARLKGFVKLVTQIRVYISNKAAPYFGILRPFRAVYTCSNSHQKRPFL